MGVVRDVTVDNLTQAVQGISSTGISDSTGQAINNTLSTLGKDTSLQGIITAISGLGTALGSDKANISGDNIASPSTFRANINAQEVITPELITTWIANTTYVISSQFIKVFKYGKMVVISFGAEIKASDVNTRLLKDLPTAIRAGGNANYFGAITGVNGASSRIRIDGSNMIVDSAITTQQWYSGLFVYFIA